MFLGLWVLHVLLRARWSVSVPPEPLRRKGRSEQPFTAEPSRLPGPESQPPPHLPGFPGGTVVNSLPASAGGARDVGSIPGSGRSPGEGNDNPLQSCPESDMTKHEARTPPDRPVTLVPGPCRLCFLSRRSHCLPHWLALQSAPQSSQRAPPRRQQRLGTRLRIPAHSSAWGHRPLPAAAAEPGDPAAHSCPQQSLGTQTPPRSSSSPWPAAGIQCLLNDRWMN